MEKNLVIVESPAKAKTIESYLGKDYTVTSSYGHIRDLPKKGMSIDIEHGFKPNYEIAQEKQKTADRLKKQSVKAKSVWLATDEDREGEAIAWHLVEVLKLSPNKTKRITFHEITKPAILSAIKNPRSIDKQLVDAQQARRVLDRLVGYELSPVLWKKVRPGLSAGRVQSVAVRLIVEREREIDDFKPETSFKVTASFHNQANKIIPAELNRKLPDDKTARHFLGTLKKATYTIADVNKRPGIKNPGAPFTTSTLQQEAGRKLGFSVKQTMVLAQRLYESGKITYMRTDSVTMAQTAIAAAKARIESEFGKNYVQIRQYKTKTRAAQEAHEAIRPTNFSVPDAGTSTQEKKLYRLIYQRSLASQMMSAQIEKTTALINISEHREHFVAQGETITFMGFLKAYEHSKTKEIFLPDINVKDRLSLIKASAVETHAKAPSRYSEAALVRKLEELGIGRPSTYAPTISTIQSRGYVAKGSSEGEPKSIIVLELDKGQLSETTDQVVSGGNKGRLVPTDVGKIVTDFLKKHFSDIIDYDFTASVEEEFDGIAQGEKKWNAMIEGFYRSFHKTIKASEKVSRSEVTQARELGKDPKNNYPIYAKYGRFGPMLQRGDGGENSEKPDFAPIPPNTDLEDVTLDQALKMFSLPRKLGKTDQNESIEVNVGRYGAYIKHGSSYISIQPNELFSITGEEAKNRIKHGAAITKSGVVKDFKEAQLQVKYGRYGPYVTDGNINARIPKGVPPSSLTESEAKKIFSKARRKKLEKLKDN